MNVKELAESGEARMKGMSTVVLFHMRMVEMPVVLLMNALVIA